MRKKYQRILKLIAFLLVLCGGIGVTYLFYDKAKDNETIVEADGELSINYINGKKINSDGTYEFSITNNSDKDFYYEIAINELKELDANFKYDLISSDASINMTNISLDKDNLLLADNILIKSKATQNFKLIIENSNKTSFKLSIHKNNDTAEYFFATILKNNTVNKNATTKLAEEVATTNEGLIEDVDDYGLTYYFRGNVTNNYVSFANNLWRIVRINGNGTVRLVLNEATSELTSYHNSKEDSEKYEESDINKNLNAYYENNLKAYDNYIAKSKFCNETGNNISNDNKTYNIYTRLLTNQIPTFNCLGEKYNSKIGLLTADEVVFAGANSKSDNKEYYLYNSSIENVWWTSSLATTKGENFYPFVVTVDGKLSNETSGTLYRGLRPVINLTKKVTVSGTGTKDDPYVINE